MGFFEGKKCELCDETLGLVPLGQTGIFVCGNHLKSDPASHFVHPKSIVQLESVYRNEYRAEIESCDRWIEWCQERDDHYGVNFHQGMRSAHVFNNIKMEQLLRVLKKEKPNA